MSVATQLIISTLKFVLIVLFGILYTLGGRTGVGKWVRRYLGAILFGLGIIALSYWQGTFNWIYFVYIPLLAASLTVGYGGDTFLEKLKRRAIYGLLIGLSCLPFAILNGAWILFGFQVVLAFGASVILGVWNPLLNAVEEENLIAVCSVLFVPFMV